MTPAPAAPRRAPRAAGGMAESLATPRHRSSGNISVVPPADGCGVQPAESSRRGIGLLRTPRRPDAYDLSPSPGARARLAAAAQTCSLHDFCREWRGPLGVLTALLLAFMIGACCGQQRAAPADADAGGNFSAEPEGAFARLSEERLKSITSNLAMLQSLHKVVVKADDTYEEVMLLSLSSESRANAPSGSALKLPPASASAGAARCCPQHAPIMKARSRAVSTPSGPRHSRQKSCKEHVWAAAARRARGPGEE